MIHLVPVFEGLYTRSADKQRDIIRRTADPRRNMRKFQTKLPLISCVLQADKWPTEAFKNFHYLVDQFVLDTMHARMRNFWEGYIRNTRIMEGLNARQTKLNRSRTRLE